MNTQELLKRARNIEWLAEEKNRGVEAVDERTWQELIAITTSAKEHITSFQLGLNTPRTWRAVHNTAKTLRDTLQATI